MIVSTNLIPMNYDKADWKLRRACREAYVLRQKGLCYHCKADLEGPASPEMMAKKIRTRIFPDGFFKNPVHLHHNHDTRMTIGAVHAQCNAVLWQYHGE